MTGGEKNPASAGLRLVERTEPGASPAEAWAVELLAAAAPYEAPLGRKQRVQRALAHVSARRAPFLLRPAVVAGVLLGCGALASAGLGPWRGWMVHAYERIVSGPTPAKSVASSEPRRIAMLSNGSAPVTALPAVVPGPAPLVVGRDASISSRSRRAMQSPSTSEDTGPVLEAMRALRLEGNPVRARILLARYLERHPTGRLAEEALAISIEAAVTHHDADAAALSARYLRLYPTGPFRALAQRTLTAGAASNP